MEILKTKIEGLKLFKVPYFVDSRGGFMESYQSEKFNNFIYNTTFVQDNESLSNKNVLRGLHFQLPPFSQGKLVRVINGAVLDVAVDLRKNSPTYGKYESVLLSADNKLQMWIPHGFAHGFLSLEKNTLFSYKCTEFYNAAAECSIIWNDPDLNIDWGIKTPILSDKDKDAIRFKEFNSPFDY